MGALYSYLSPLAKGPRRVATSLSGRIRYLWLFALSCALVATVVLLIISTILGSPAPRPAFPLAKVDGACDGFTEYSSPESPPASLEIPNYVHYVWMLRNPAELKLDFSIFITVYSAHLFLAPERIYLHTDAKPEVFEAARRSAHSWTARTLAIPGVEPRFVKAPTVTKHGVPVDLMEHRSDFLRIEALRDLGGLYLDMDAVPLRDVASLRKSGFANVLGGSMTLRMRFAGFINNGVMMARPGSMLMTVWHAASHRFYDGAWDTASIQLLTDLGQRMVAVPNEVLILHDRAFAPASWEHDGQRSLFIPKLDALPLPSADAGLDTVGESCVAVMDWAAARESHVREDDGVIDLSSTYILHAFDGDVHHMSGWDGVVDLQYVLSRRSNYARAVFPAVWHAVQAGIIPEGKLYR